jgi:hypothetical protein
MPVSTEVDKEKDLTIHRARGLITDEQMFEVQEKFYEDKPTTLQLWDMSETDLSLITIQGLRRFIEIDARRGLERGQAKCAVVVVKTLQFGLARMAETFGDLSNLPFQFRIFKKLDSAMAWLTEPSEGV